MSRKASEIRIQDRAQVLVSLGGARDGRDQARIKHLNKLIRTHGGKVDAVRYLIDKDMGN